MGIIPIMNNILHLGNKEKLDNFTPLKMQKILYFLYGWHLAITGETPFSEKFIAGAYGPVIPSVKDLLSPYGAMPIDDYVEQWSPEAGASQVLFVDTDKQPLFAEILQKVWTQYSKLSTEQLSTLSHQDGSPWSQTTPGHPISESLVRDDFIAKSKPRINPHP